MALNAVHDALEDIPEQYRDLYTEKDGKWELTGVTGVKTQADVERLQTALSKERDDHKTTKSKFQPWAELNHDEVMGKLDRIPELEAAAAGKLDEAGIEELVEKRVNGTINSKIAPLERQIKSLTEERDEARALSDERGLVITNTKIKGSVREALVKAKVIPEAHEDALLQAERLFEIRADDGAIVTRDNVGVTPGVDPGQWLQDIQPTRPHWWPASSGGGARGGNTGVGGVAENPWSAAHWNMTQQGQILKEKGREVADRLAKAAGTTVGGPKPREKAA